MDGSMQQEIEIKLPFPSAVAALDALKRLGAKRIHGRRFEDNIVFDRSEQALDPAGKLLRLRRYGDQAWLTFKAPVPGTHRHKVREEHETSLADADAAQRILEHLGFKPHYRYQKFRTLFELGALHVCLDETPIGCFVELEGPPEEIDRAAKAMGLAESHYVIESYRELHQRAAHDKGEAPGDMVFEPAPDERK
jgi:adenylate cyclase class 2